MFFNSEMIVTETERIAHIELRLSALKYHGNFYQSNIMADPAGGTNSEASR